MYTEGCHGFNIRYVTRKTIMRVAKAIYYCNNISILSLLCALLSGKNAHISPAIIHHGNYN